MKLGIYNTHLKQKQNAKVLVIYWKRKVTTPFKRSSRRMRENKRVKNIIINNQKKIKNL